MNPRWTLGAWYFAYFAFIGAYLPYFSLYLEALNISPSDIGFLMSMGQVMRMLAPAVWGWLSDQSGRRTPIVRLSAVLSFACFGSYFFAAEFWGLMGATLLLHLFWSGALPLVEALTFGHLRNDPEAYGRIRLWGSVGFIATVMGMGLLLDHLSVRSVLWSGWFLLALVAVVAWNLREASVADEHPVRQLPGNITEPRVLALLIAGFFMVAAHGPLYVFYSIHLVGNGYGTTLTGALWSLGVLAEILVFLWMPQLSRRFPIKPILLFCFVVASIRFLIIGWWVDSLSLIVLAQLLHAATFGAHHAATVAALNQWFAPSQQGRIQALYGSLSFGAGGMVGAILAGQAWERYGAEAAFGIAAMLALVGFIVVGVGMPKGATFTR